MPLWGHSHVRVNAREWPSPAEVNTLCKVERLVKKRCKFVWPCPQSSISLLSFLLSALQQILDKIDLLKLGNQSKLTNDHLWPCCLFIWKLEEFRKKMLEGEVQTVAAFSPLHVWQIASGCSYQIVSFGMLEILLKAVPPLFQCQIDVGGGGFRHELWQVLVINHIDPSIQRRSTPRNSGKHFAERQITYFSTRVGKWLIWCWKYCQKVEETLWPYLKLDTLS